MSELERVIHARRQAILAKRDAVIAARARTPCPPMADYAWPTLEALLTHTVAVATGISEIHVQLEMIEREKFGGDIALKVPSLLKQGGPKRFMTEFQPAIAQALQGEALAHVIKGVKLKGMYINLTLTDEWLLRTAESVMLLGERFGLNDSMYGRNVLVEYSSPNVAKVLHAGHIRSTMTGHVLSNLYEACGATVFRVNHINDFGGFGFLLEGYRRFASQMPADYSENDRLLAIYGIRRTLERIVDNGLEADSWGDEEREVLSRYFPNVTDLAGARSAFAELTAASDQRFERLEQGYADEVALWEQMVGWSLTAFNEFYRLLKCEIDFVIGESFYFQDGVDVIRKALADGTAEIFSAEEAKVEIAEVEGRCAAGDMTLDEADVCIQGIRKDIGSTVARLLSGERLVVLRTDGRSIYATRDIGAIMRRNEFFAPHLVMYVVGQEQRSHFERLFAAADILGLVINGIQELGHLSFGFYVDKETGKKLSSRQSVSNVMKLIELAEQYFRSRMLQRGDLSEEECTKAARELTVGSLVFNDLKQDIKGSVAIDSSRSPSE